MEKAETYGIELKRCCKNHVAEVIEIDLSKAYGDERYKKMHQVRCAVKSNTCEFSDYFFRKLDAIYSWNDREDQTNDK